MGQRDGAAPVQRAAGTAAAAPLCGGSRRQRRGGRLARSVIVCDRFWGLHAHAL